MDLVGRSVVICRTRAQSAALSAGIESLGAAVVEIPVLAIVEPDDGGVALREALRAEPPHDWVVVTSANGVDALARALGRVPGHADVAPGTAVLRSRVATIGTATATRLRDVGIEADLIPETFVGESLVAEFPAAPPDGGTVLVAQAGGARDVVRSGLAAKGWTVEAVVAYQSVPASVPPALAERAIRADAICFTSASTVDNFVRAVGVAAVPRAVVCIGPVTADAAATHGLAVAAVADPHTIAGVVDALRTLDL